MNPPDQMGRWAVAAAGCAWVAAWAGRSIGWPSLAASVIGTLLLASIKRRAAALLAMVMVAAALSGVLSVQREATVLGTFVPEGLAEVIGTVVDDPRPGANGFWFLIRPDTIQVRDRESSWQGPPLLVSAVEESAVMAGERVAVAGRMAARSGSARGDPYAGTIDARTIAPVGVATGFFRAANLVRSRVESELAPVSNRPAAALVSGFLIGDIRELPTSDAQALKRAGLSHYVAVSGSNVALFLLLWWVIIGPLGFGSRRRAVLGLLGLILFTIITRWEPSVLRASVMAGVVLVGRAIGWSIGPWTALGGGVTGLLLISAELVSDVGFQLSVAATAGVIAGAGYRPLSRLPLVGATLAATVSAQLAVAPLLLIHFGTLPLFSPLSNLLAGPMVIAGTALGGLGVLSGVGLLVNLSAAFSGIVLAIARAAAPWPQLDWVGYLGVLTTIWLGIALNLRRPMAVLAAAWAFMTIGLQVSPVPTPSIVFLNVGQGDSTLLIGDDGSAVLVDGGPDPGVLVERLRHYGIDHLDLVIASHHHHDHVAGLTAAVEGFPTGLLWHSDHPDPGPEMRALLDTAGRLEVLVEVPRPGWTAQLGDFQISVRGPLRRYASPNDQSIVLVVQVGETTVLLPGDVETYAQQDLGTIRADVLKVPHQGAATSDLNWLRATGAGLAVIPVGPNDYGHPAPEVLRVLEEMGAEIRRTDRDGDVVVSLSP